MKKSCLLLILSVCLYLFGNAQVSLPSLSPTQIIKQDFGIGYIELTYSRPSIKSRRIFGDLVPFNKLWRTGANAATRIALSEPVEIGGKRIDSGTYALYTIPGIDNWDVIFNKGINNWGTDGYKESEDIVRIKADAGRMKNKMETFTIDFSDIAPESCLLNIRWEKTVVSIPITARFTGKVKLQLEAAMKTDKKPYWKAAQFYYEYDKNLPLALENVTKALEAENDAFWMWLYKAKIQKDMGDNNGALQSSKKSMELAAAAKNDDYVKMNKDLQKSIKQNK